METDIPMSDGSSARVRADALGKDDAFGGEVRPDSCPHSSTPGCDTWARAQCAAQREVELVLFSPA
eukprot:3285177-Pyramimonas_sp.AAC.1